MTTTGTPPWKLAWTDLTTQQQAVRGHRDCTRHGHDYVDMGPSLGGCRYCPTRRSTDTTSGRYVVEEHGRRWAVTDLSWDANKPRWTHPTEQLAREHVAHLERRPTTAKPAQGSLFDTQEAAHP